MHVTLDPGELTRLPTSVHTQANFGFPAGTKRPAFERKDEQLPSALPHPGVSDLPRVHAVNVAQPSSGSQRVSGAAIDVFAPDLPGFLTVTVHGDIDGRRVSGTGRLELLGDGASGRLSITLRAP